MIEKMAEPIAKEIASQTNYVFTASDSSDTGWEGEMEAAVELVRKALTILLEPCEAMIEEGGEYLNTAYNNWQSDCQRAVATLQKMIQAALDEK